MISDTDWRGRTALVIGDSGFIGRWLSLRLCENGAQVIGLSRHKIQACGVGFEGALNDRITYIEGSIADRPLLRQTMREFRVDTVFHLAGQAKVKVSQQSPVQTFEANVQGTWNVLEAARESEQKVRVIVASSKAVYADSGQLQHTEASQVDALSPYAASKLCAEVLASCYHRTYGLPVCVARTCNVYGGGDKSLERIIPGTICSVLRGESPVIHSDGLAQREYLYVEDAIAGYMMLATAMDDPQICGETFNFNSGSPVSVMTVVEAIMRLMGKTELNARAQEEKQHGTVVRHASSVKAQNLGWRVETSLESGLQKTISWYQLHANALLKEVQN